MFGRQENEVVKEFRRVYEEGAHETESEFLESLNAFTVIIEKSRDYSTNSKLKIYELLSQISNCSSNERDRYAKKLIKVLK